MDTMAKIKLLEDRLQKLSSSEKENNGVCRKIKRNIRNVQKGMAIPIQNCYFGRDRGCCGYFDNRVFYEKVFAAFRNRQCFDIGLRPQFPM